MKKSNLYILAMLVLASFGIFFFLKNLHTSRIMALSCCGSSNACVASNIGALSCVFPDSMASNESIKRNRRNFYLDSDFLGSNFFFIENAIEKELRERTVTYESRFKQPIPACEQCYDLELLLILERAIQTNIAIPHIAKDNDVAIRDELENAIAEYEKRFKNIPPWWWICPDEERLKRLKNAIETNMPYRDFSYRHDVEDVITYELGKTIAQYEMQFKKQPPEWDCSNEMRLWRLQRELGIPSPYLMEEEKAEFETKLKSEYEEKFVTSMTDFELSISRIHFKTHFGIYGETPSISITRTATGAIAKYRDHYRDEYPENLEIELDMGEWLDFVNALYKLRFDKWEKNYHEPLDGVEPRFKGELWSLKVSFLDKDELIISGRSGYLPSWKELDKIMSSMRAKIKEKANAEIETILKAEYKKRFGEPITYLELSISHVDFSISKTFNDGYTRIRASRTKTGALVDLKSCDGKTRRMEFNIEEWLAFIRTLYECRIDEWKKDGDMEEIFGISWDLDVFASGSNEFIFKSYNNVQFEPHIYGYINYIDVPISKFLLGAGSFYGYPPNWHKFIKTIYDMKIKVEKEGTLIKYSR